MSSYENAIVWQMKNDKIVYASTFNIMCVSEKVKDSVLPSFFCVHPKKINTRNPNTINIHVTDSIMIDVKP